MHSLAQYIIRILAFVRKEIVNVLRQPRLVASLILGPFLILLLFGIGYRDQARVLRTLFVVPDDSPMRPVVEDYSTRLGRQIDPRGIIADEAEADRQLRRKDIDLVVVVPSDPAAQIDNNEQATFRMIHYEIDPYEQTYIEILGRNYIEEINRQVLLTAADQGKAEAAALQERIASVEGVAVGSALFSVSASAAAARSEASRER